MNRIHFRATAVASCVSLFSLLAACGGGGGGGAETPTRQFLLASAGLGGETTMTFANGEQTVGTRDIVGVDPAAPEKGAVTLDTAAFSNRRLTLNSYAEFNYANGVVSQGRIRYAVYFKDGQLYKLDARTDGTALPVPQQVSSLQSNEVCLSNGSVDMDQSFGDPSGADREWIFLPAPGVDGLCGTADDGSRAVRLNMSATDVPPAVGKPLVPIYQSGTLALVGMVMLSGNQVVRLAADMASATPLFTVDPSTLTSIDTLGIGLSGWWYFQEAGRLWAVDLSQPAVRTPVATLGAGETVAFLGGSRGTDEYLQIDSASGSRIVRANRASNVTTVATSTTRMIEFVTSPTRLVWLTSEGIFSGPIAGGAAVALLPSGTGEFVSFIFAAGETLWTARRTTDPNDSTLTAIDTLVIGTSGGPLTTFANTALFTFLLPASWSLAAPPFEAVNIILAEGVTSDQDYRGASLRSRRGSDGSLLTTYGTVPADQPGLFVTSGDPVGYGGAGLFVAYAFTLVGPVFSDSIDLYHFDSDAVGLTRVTRNPP